MSRNPLTIAKIGLYWVFTLANQREAAKRSALEFTYLARKLMDGK